MELKLMDWNDGIEDADLIIQIALRASEFGCDFHLVVVAHDLAMLHLNGCPLRLKDLLDAPFIEFWDEMFRIRQNLDRKTGKLRHGLLPHFRA